MTTICCVTNAIYSISERTYIQYIVINHDEILVSLKLKRGRTYTMTKILCSIIYFIIISISCLNYPNKNGIRYWINSFCVIAAAILGCILYMEMIK